MTSHCRLLILVGLVPALVAMRACRKAEQDMTQTSADTSKMMYDSLIMADTSLKMMRDSAPLARGDHRPAAKHAKPRHGHAKVDGGPSSVDTAVEQLSQGQVRYEGPDTMVVDSTVHVVKLAKATQFRPAVPPPHEQVLTARTRIGDSANVCLDGSALDFQIRPPSCRAQVVTSDTSNVWLWLVTPLRAGQKVLQVHVEALLANMGHKGVFDSTYAVTVNVAPRTYIERANDALARWKVILAGVAAVLASAIAISKNVRALLLSLFRRRRPPGGSGEYDDDSTP